MTAALLTLAVAFPAADPLAGMAPLQGVWRTADGRQIEFAEDRTHADGHDGLSDCTVRVVIRRGIMLVDGGTAQFALTGDRLWIGGIAFRR